MRLKADASYGADIQVTTPQWTNKEKVNDFMTSLSSNDVKQSQIVPVKPQAQRSSALRNSENNALINARRDMCNNSSNLKVTKLLSVADNNVISDTTNDYSPSKTVAFNLVDDIGV